MTFTPIADPDDPYQRVADPEVTDKWTDDPQIQGRYLGFLVWMHYWLYNKYNGKVAKVPHPHIDYETRKYRERQNTISDFINRRLVKTAQPDEKVLMSEEVSKYIIWYNQTMPDKVPGKGVIEQFQNSEIGKYIKVTARNTYLVGHRFLSSDNAELEEGEAYFREAVLEEVLDGGNFGIASETPDEYYARVCCEYDEHKHIFDSTGEYTPSIVNNLNINTERAPIGVVDLKATDSTVLDNGVILQGTVLQALPEVEKINLDAYAKFM